MSGFSTPEPLTVAQRALASAAACLFAGLAGLAFTGMFASVQAEMRPYFGQLAWIVPVGVDAGVLALILAGLLLEWLAMPMPALRWIAGVFMAASIWLNLAAADGRATGAVGHAALPVLFIACVEAARHAVRRRAGIAAGTVREGIPVARWLLAPWPTFMLWRRMVLWQVTSYQFALGMEQDRRHAITVLRAAFGAGWQRTAPADLVWMLRTGVHIDQAVTRVSSLATSVNPDRSDGQGVMPGPEDGTGRYVAPLPDLEAGPGPDRQADRIGRTRRPRPSGQAGPSERTSGRADQTAAPRPAGHRRRDDTDLEAAALALLAAEPHLSGGELGRRLGVTERHGRRLRLRLRRDDTDPGSEGHRAGREPAPRPVLTAEPDVSPGPVSDLSPDRGLRPGSRYAPDTTPRPDGGPDPELDPDRDPGPPHRSGPDPAAGPGLHPDPRSRPDPDTWPGADIGQGRDAYLDRDAPGTPDVGARPDRDLHASQGTRPDSDSLTVPGLDRPVMVPPGVAAQSAGTEVA